MKTTLILLSTVLLLFMVACQPPTVKIDLDQVQRTIQSLEDEFAAAVNNKDADAVMALYADEFMAMRPEVPPVTSKAAMLAEMKTNMTNDTSGTTVKFEVINIMAAGNLVVETGREISTLSSGEERYGKYVAVWKKIGDKYLIARDINNSDADYEDDDEDDDDDE